ncbi:lipocalin-like domain-containing protein [Parachitinimonas caeni]|uniref:Carotenoid 1,2-hydratase n=1 Tax=Parachitinimonas caeni TaxID=3031301 RepID=A0ABT7DV09_9NEIS|nr:carotenoid 1,2-hydratase [Parachitinimonas caeni]MDK2123892.1 carotenoid 1,2-hydratase [Parachitinimonas caeni]
MRVWLGLIVLGVFGLTKAVAAEFAPVVPGVALQFPRDFGAHPAFKTEWWYLTGWLKLPDGKPAGFQVTFFRSATGLAGDNPSAFAPRQLIFGHAALSDGRSGRFLHEQKIARAGLGLAEAAEGNTQVSIDDWQLFRQPDGRYQTRIVSPSFEYQFTLAPSQPLLLQGEAGFSRKGRAPGQASYYYSEPHLKLSGQLRYQGKTETVTGEAWLDHEWSSEVLAGGTVGWDWAGINLDDGGALTLFRLRDAAGATRWAGGSRRWPDGRSVALAPEAIRLTPQQSWTSSRTGTPYPVSMALEVSSPSPERWLLQPLLQDQEFDARPTTGALYWEGAVRAIQQGKEVGRGYLELTGYGKQALKM